MAPNGPNLIRLSVVEDERRPTDTTICEAIAVAEQLNQPILLYWAVRPEVRTYVAPRDTRAEITERLTVLHREAFTSLG